jgi:hypothetical protein
MAPLNRRFHALLVVLALIVSPSAFARSLVYVLDGGGRAVARVDVERGMIEAKAPLPFTDDATEIVASPDGKRLVVLARGKTSAAAAIVDSATLNASPRIDLGRGDGDVVFSRDGKSVFVLSGDALVGIDLATATITKRLALDRAGDQFATVNGGATGVVFQKGGKVTNARLTFVALDSLEVLGTVDLTGKPAEIVEIPGSGYLYAVESNGVDVVSIADRKLAGTVTVGNRARLGGVDPATRSLYALATDDQKNAMLYVIRGAALAGSISAGIGAPEVFRLTADGKRAFVGNAHGVTEITLGAELTARPAAQLYSGFTAVGMFTVDSTATPDGRRVLLLMRQGDKCCTFAITDPAESRKVATMQPARKSRRVLQGIAGGGGDGVVVLRRARRCEGARPRFL